MPNMHRFCKYRSIHYSIHIFYKFVALSLVLLNTCFTVKMTLVLHAYIFSENEHKVVDRKTKMLHDVSYFYVTGFIK